MKLIYDARAMAQQFTGLGRYTASLLKALLDSANADSFEIHVLLDATSELDANVHVAGKDCHWHRVPVPAISLGQQLTLPRWVNRIGGDRYFYPHFDLPLRVNIPSTFVVHDLIPLKVPGYVRHHAWAKKFYFSQMIRLGVRRASRCFAVSRTTRADILDLVGEKYAAKVDVAGEGPVIAPTGCVADHGAPGVTLPYLLYVGDRRPHKNVKKVVDLFALLRVRHGYPGRLVLAGSTQNHGFDLERYLAGRDDIVILGNVTDDQLAWLYQNTDALIFLSEYEGFGLPVVEAARFDCPMILSDGGSLAEIAPPTACVIARATSLDESAATAARYLQAKPRIDLRAYRQRYSWQHAARTIFPEAFAD